jgi:hypothetical protein
VKKVFIGLSMIFSTLSFADENHEYQYICVKEELMIKVSLVREDDGFDIYSYDKNEYIHLLPSNWEIPKNSCNKGFIPLFLKKEEDG